MTDLTCPCCSARLDGHTALTGNAKDQPTPGSACICAYCGTPLIRNVAPTYRVMTQTEIAECNKDLRFRIALQAAHNFGRERGSKAGRA